MVSRVAREKDARCKHLTSRAQAAFERIDIPYPRATSADRDPSPSLTTERASPSEPAIMTSQDALSGDTREREMKQSSVPRRRIRTRQHRMCPPG
ncbi:hypothetical protein VTO73DRAFT_9043 [Trametes versicolor]